MKRAFDDGWGAVIAKTEPSKKSKYSKEREDDDSHLPRAPTDAAKCKARGRPTVAAGMWGGETSSMTEVTEHENVDVLKVKTKRGTEIVAVYVKNPAAKLTLLYSHATLLI
ncbi:hypothetical protein CASFOL_018232 [Castilleja foliolosa]|uniref:Uncharacterized protein n=1 Tax=Castilleja foliolosa TaxID=1961234 RepID=A0ABD3D7H1_9LAMI